MVKIVTDSAADLPKELTERYDIKIVPLTVKIDGVEYREGLDISATEFAKKMMTASELPKTSQPSPAAFRDVFNMLAKTSQVLCLTLSSKLSGTYQSAMIAKEISDGSIEIFDTLAGSLGQGIQVLKAAELAAKGLSLQEIIQKLKEIRKEINIIISLETLENIVKGGRLTKFQGSIAKFLDIKVLLHAVDGTVEILDKVRGKKKMLQRLIEVIGERCEDFSEKIFGITHLDNEEDALLLKEIIQQKYNPKEIIINHMGSTMGTYAGKGGLIVSF